MDGSETVETATAEVGKESLSSTSGDLVSATPPWQKALAYSEVRGRLNTPEDEERYLASLEESLMTAAGTNTNALNKPDVMDLLRLFFIGETFSFTDDDGTEYVWNVTKAKEIVEETPHEVVAFRPGEYGITAEHIRSRYPGFEMDHAVGADLLRPVIFLPFKGEHLLIDGWHRLYRAVAESVETLPCYILTEEEAGAILASRTWKGDTPG